ncbi:DMT family transporter [Cohnella abietis]|uniref:Transporter n=1 Tax=Cohnella abietis TaxID=2507935 RepID=A0A3T1DCT5_9BACL|nr:DMT family transporter [Cohnella abietis]BBI35903.1 transporter [Cohnella abietis]
MQVKQSSFKTFLMIASLVTIWGLAWPIFKISLDYAPPLIFAGLRNLGGGLLLFLLFLSKWKEIRWKSTWPIYLISSFFNVIIYYGLQAYGLVLMPSGLFSIIVYLQPVLVGILAWRWLGDAITAHKIAGLIFGFLGVAAVSFKEVSSHIAVAGIIMALITAVSWAIGAIYVKKVTHQVNSIWLAAIQCIIGGIVITTIGSFTENWSAIAWDSAFILCFLYGSVLGISVAWVIYFHLVHHGDSSIVASYTFIVPLIAVISGTFLLQEAFTLPILIGLIFIITSIYLVNRKPKASVTASIV